MIRLSGKFKVLGPVVLLLLLGSVPAWAQRPRRPPLAIPGAPLGRSDWHRIDWQPGLRQDSGPVAPWDAATAFRPAEEPATHLSLIPAAGAARPALGGGWVQVFRF